jgi:hypothetical protein
MTLGDLEAIYTYMHHLATNANIVGQADKATVSAARYCTAGSVSACTAGETCDTTANECVGRTCNTAADCDVCQKCDGNNKCAAYSAAEAAQLGGCIATGL